MKHIAPVSRTPSQANLGNFTGGGIDALESIILIVFTVVFNGWDNFPAVIQNLQKFYSKT